MHRPLLFITLAFVLISSAQASPGHKGCFPSLKRGDRVQRSTAWIWASQDGDFRSAHRYGTVLQVADWHNESGRALIVHWDLTDQVNIYRFGAGNGTLYDVESINETVDSTRSLPDIPAHLQGQTRIDQAPESRQTGVREENRTKKALMTLYESLGGATWAYREYWGSGVKCNAHREVFAIDLRENGLHGSLPKAFFSSLQSLLSLNLGMNSISGTIPSEIGRLSKLRFLDLHQNKLIGHLPPALAHCSRLEWVDLSANKLHGTLPAHLAQLHDLKFCFLGHNQLDVTTSNLPDGLLQLTSLARGHPRLEYNHPILDTLT